MPRRVDRDERRREFAIAVWGIIAEQGIEGVTLRAVARVAGVSVGRVQHYYPTREELVRDSCRVMIELAEEHFAAAVRESPPAQTLRALVLRAVPATTDFTRGVAIWTAYLAKSVDNPGIAELVRRSHRGVVELAAELIDRARRDCVMNPGTDAHDLALELLCLSDGYATRVLSGSITAEQALAQLDRRLAAEGG